MKCGVLCDQSGQIKRSWALVSDAPIVPVEDGDQVIEWDVDHGETLLQTEEKLAKIREAVKEQERITTLRDKATLDAYLNAKGRIAELQTVRLDAISGDPIYYRTGKGLHHRQKDADGDISETPSNPRHRLERINKQ